MMIEATDSTVADNSILSVLWYLMPGIVDISEALQNAPEAWNSKQSLDQGLE